MSIWYEGKAADGTHVLFTADPYTQRQTCELLVNGAPVTFKDVQRYRDGGTTIVGTPIGTFYKPSPLSSKPEHTTFAGKVLREINHSSDEFAKQLSHGELDALLERLANSAPKDRNLKGYLGGYMSALLDIREELKL